MSRSERRARAFYEQVARDRRVWMLFEDGGLGVMQHPAGHAVVPAWSSQRRARNGRKRLAAVWRQAELRAVPWESFRETYARGFAAEGIHVGVNWGGRQASGYDLPAPDVVRHVEARMRPA